MTLILPIHLIWLDDSHDDCRMKEMLTIPGHLLLLKDLRNSVYLLFLLAA